MRVPRHINGATKHPQVSEQNPMSLFTCINDEYYTFQQYVVNIPKPKWPGCHLSPRSASKLFVLRIHRTPAFLEGDSFSRTVLNTVYTTLILVPYDLSYATREYIPFLPPSPSMNRNARSGAASSWSSAGDTSDQNPNLRLFQRYRFNFVMDSHLSLVLGTADFTHL